jgi:hypothetical protein
MTSADDGSTGKQIYGLDCEWKPEHPNRSVNTQKKKNCVSVLQLSTRTKAFVVDLQHLLRTATTEITPMSEIENELNTILLQLFTNPNVLIIGYGVKQDLEKLNDSFPHMPCFDFRTMARKFRHISVSMSVSRGNGNSSGREGNVLDLQPCVGYVLNNCQRYQQQQQDESALGGNVMSRAIIGVSAGAGAGAGTTRVNKQQKGNHCSLSEACAMLLHKKLSKEMQLSDWTVRPLSGPQLEYAAIDALVLCVLFDVLVNKPKLITH